MQAPKILPVVEPPNVKAKPHHPFLPKVGVGVPGGGSLLLMLSPVKTGKSTIISNLLLNESCYGQLFFDDVQIMSNTIANDVTSRFLNKAFNCHDHYDDKIIDGIINRQKSFDKVDQPEIALILDDCLYEYSLVETDKGKKYIKNVEVGDKVLSDNGFVEVYKIFNQGKKECYKIILENKCELILTEEHKLYTKNGMKPMGECMDEIIITKFGDSRILSKEYYNKVQCYDLNVNNENHRFYANDICVSNCLGSIKRESKINHLASRYRHFNIKLLIISSQKFRGSVSPIIRANATDVIIGSPFPNMSELNAISEEFGDNFGGKDNFLKHYHLCTPNKYDFCYLSLQDNPPIMYHNFEKVVLVGGQQREIIEEPNPQLHYSNNIEKEDS